LPSTSFKFANGNTILDFAKSFKKAEVRSRSVSVREASPTGEGEECFICRNHIQIGVSRSVLRFFFKKDIK